MNDIQTVVKLFSAWTLEIIPRINRKILVTCTVTNTVVLPYPLHILLPMLLRALFSYPSLHCPVPPPPPPPPVPLYPLLSCPAPFMHSSPLFQGPSVTNSAALIGVGATHWTIIYQGTQFKKTDLPPPATMTAKGSSSTSLFIRAGVWLACSCAPAWTKREVDECAAALSCPSDTISEQSSCPPVLLRAELEVTCSLRTSQRLVALCWAGESTRGRWARVSAHPGTPAPVASAPSRSSWFYRQQKTRVRR